MSASGVDVHEGSSSTPPVELVITMLNGYPHYKMKSLKTSIARGI
jgi:hypothetical protein